MNDTPPLALKIYRNDTVKRMNRVPKGFAQLENFIGKHFKELRPNSPRVGKSFIATYFDDEGDEISVSDDEDLRSAASFATGSGLPVLKLSVRHVDEPAPEGPRLRSIPTNGVVFTDRTSTARPTPRLDLNALTAQMQFAKESEADSARHDREKEDSMLLEETISLVSQLEKRKAERQRQNEEGEDVLKKVNLETSMRFYSPIMQSV